VFVAALVATPFALYFSGHDEGYVIFSGVCAFFTFSYLALESFFWHRYMDNAKKPYPQTKQDVAKGVKFFQEMDHLKRKGELPPNSYFYRKPGERAQRGCPFNLKHPKLKVPAKHFHSALSYKTRQLPENHPHLPRIDPPPRSNCLVRLCKGAKHAIAGVSCGLVGFLLFLPVWGMNVVFTAVSVMFCCHKVRCKPKLKVAITKNSLKTVVPKGNLEVELSEAPTTAKIVGRSVEEGTQQLDEPTDDQLMHFNEGTAPILSLDGLHVTWSQWIWFAFIFGVCAVLEYLLGAMFVVYWDLLGLFGCCQHTHTCKSYPKAVAQFILESSFCIHIREIAKDPQTNHEIGVFTFENVPLLTPDPDSTKKGALRNFTRWITVWVDLTTKEMVHAETCSRRKNKNKNKNKNKDTTIDDDEEEEEEEEEEDLEVITAKDTLLLLFWNFSTAAHGMLHSYANWGVDTQHADDIVRQNSVVTVMYNYAGRSKFPVITKCLWLGGMIDTNFTSTGSYFGGPQGHLYDNLTQGIVNGSPSTCSAGRFGDKHLMKRLCEYSEFGTFLCRLWPQFKELFELSKIQDESFVRMNEDCHFIGTVLHSLDHHQAAHLIGSPLWFNNPDNSTYGDMSLLVKVIRNGFTSDVHGYLFNKRFKFATHPFYSSVYRVALGLETKSIGGCLTREKAKELADSMNVCICT